MAKLNKTNFQIRLKRGLVANINTDLTKYMAVEGEPHYTTDTKDLYIFDGTSNVLVGGVAALAGKVSKAGDTMTGALVITPSANGTSILNVTNTAGTSVFNVDTTNQRVGIGTTAPTAKLHVEGSALFNEAGANVDFRVESDTEPNMIFLDANADTDGALYLGGSTNGLKVSKGGDLIFQGTATVFQDVNTGFAGAKVPAANAPTWTTLIGNIKAYTFAVNDYVDVEALEVPHGWKEGSDIEIHIHWATNGNNDATVRGVKWEVEYTWANMLSAGGTTAFGSIAAVSTETSIAASEPTLTHKYTSVLTFTPTGGKVGMYVKLRLKRIASVTNTAPASNPFGLAVGIHCELDRVGSRTTGGS